MKIPNSAHRGSARFNMTPMIDVVFLLIIFFLVSSHLAKQDALELDLPNAVSARDVEEDKPRVTINVLDDGTLMLGGAELGPERLEQKIRSEVADKSSDVEVRIRSSRAAPYENVEPIMLACARAGVWNVTFAVYASKSSEE